MQSTHASLAPSDWVVRWAPLLRPAGRVLDLAAGQGRHARHLAARGHSVVAVDRDAVALSNLADVGQIRCVEADLEAGAWPFAGEHFDGIVVTNYLHRPLFGPLLEALAPSGMLIYETFMVGNERFGKPSNPAFLLAPHELLDVVRGRLAVVAFEQGRVDRPKPAVVQRVCAVRGDAGEASLG